jgi:hypothetical protein
MIMRGAARYLLYAGLFMAFGSCGPLPPPPPPPVATGCPGGIVGPSVRYGSLNLSPTVLQVNPNQPVAATLYVVTSPATSAPPTLQLGTGGPMIGDTFEVCVVPNPPGANPPVTVLGSRVTGTLQDPTGGGPANFWQMLFGGLFIYPLSTQHTVNDAVKLDVSAQSLISALTPLPTGVPPSGRMLITIILPDGQHQLDLTIQER